MTFQTAFESGRQGRCPRIAQCALFRSQKRKKKEKGKGREEQTVDVVSLNHASRRRGKGKCKLNIVSSGPSVWPLTNDLQLLHYLSLLEGRKRKKKGKRRERIQ